MRGDVHLVSAAGTPERVDFRIRRGTPGWGACCIVLPHTYIAGLVTNELQEFFMLSALVLTTLRRADG